MNITLQNIGRRFNQDWIFRNIDYTFSTSKKYAILGPNGSGKSTLLKVIAGQLTPSEGKISYSVQQKPIAIEDVYKDFTIAAPYVELIEEYTLHEMLSFHFQFKKCLPGYTIRSIIELMGMQKSAHKILRNFSSGMKQRVKLALACCSVSQLVILDEPMSNMDMQGEQWYLSLIQDTITADRLLLVGSNQEREYSFCDEMLHVTNFK